MTTATASLQCACNLSVIPWEAEFLASLNNDEHAWELLARAYFFTPGTPTETNITYQLKSDPLDMQIVVTVKLEDDVLQNVVVYFDGTTLISSAINIYDKLELMAFEVRSSVKSSFSASIRKVFAPSAPMTATSGLTAEGTLTITGS